GIHAAWHFWFAVSFGGESGLRKLGLCGIHPLTQRYSANLNLENIVKVAPKITLVVGNGFSMSFGFHIGLMETWNTQSFLGWDIKSPTSEALLIDLLPNLKKLKESLTDEDDFKIFEYLQKKEYCEEVGIDQDQCFVEARHYLTIAFSHLTVEQRNKFDTEWSWYKWLKAHRENIVGGLTLNYDLLLENCLDRLSLPFDSCQANGHGNGITLCKPHGSVDFEVIGIKCPVSYPLKGLIDLNDMPIYKLDVSDLFYPRTQPLCIVPNERNKYQSFQWVEAASTKFKAALKDCTHCIVIGISYFECDRPEIDEIIDSIPESCEIIVANPNPPQEMLEKLTSNPFTIWDSYKGPVDNDGDLLMLKDVITGKSLRKCFCKSGKAYQYCCSV
ncbi:hypothetical protein, partial [Vibrio vulnificus]|uniref:hypothetical protein n=1 Tax=Vibrio vulnificus TaxID=672 RepID=UPI0039C99A1F